MSHVTLWPVEAPRAFLDALYKKHKEVCMTARMIYDDSVRYEVKRMLNLVVLYQRDLAPSQTSESETDVANLMLCVVGELLLALLNRLDSRRNE